MRKIFSYALKALLFIGIAYAEPESKVEALEGKKRESSLDKKIRQELKNKELKNKEEKKNTEEKKEIKAKRKPRAEVHHGDSKNPAQKITPSKIKEGAKGMQNQNMQNNAPKPEEKETTPQILEKIKEQALALNSIPFLVILMKLQATPLKIRSWGAFLCLLMDRLSRCIKSKKSKKNPK